MTYKFNCREVLLHSLIVVNKQSLRLTLLSHFQQATSTSQLIESLESASETQNEKFIILQAQSQVNSHEMKISTRESRKEYLHNLHLPS